ncbi:replication initiation factor domain-containing protein [Vibrio makurazakiensis]|uniref:replication initiation factor domain-containing protein n=1 Tax=Vibrio makurazakiensis TaxID=2910250 RepID=UPI003D0D22D4
MLSKKPHKYHDEIRPVEVDHLAFSFPYSSLRHLDKSNDQDFINLQFPEFKQARVNTPIAIEKAIESHRNKCRKILAHRFDDFIFKVFGFRLSRMRARGLHGYEDSMTIFDSTGTVECGLVGLGGNNDTVFVQINGTGCKKLFEHITHEKLHWWLASVLGITRLARLDLCVDDYTGIFDCQYAEKCFYEGAFRTASRGRGPTMVPHKRISQTGELSEEATLVGSRTSSVYWRIYNKKFEQKITDPEVVWYRNEVELKKCDIDLLASPASAFAGLCDFSASIDPAEPMKIQLNKKKAGLEFFARIAWVRRQCGKALAEVVSMTDGDIGEAFGLLIPTKHRRANFNTSLGIPDEYTKQKLALLESRICLQQ